jgi:hypothetical protein
MHTPMTSPSTQTSMAGSAISVVCAHELLCRARSTAARAVLGAITVVALLLLASPVLAQSFFFSTGEPDGKIATASRPSSPGREEIESADDFVLPSATLLRQATFTGLVPAGAHVSQVVVEIYRVFPNDSDVGQTSGPPLFSTSNVPTRVNSPSDVALDSRDSEASDVSEVLQFDVEILAEHFTAANSVLNQIQVGAHGEGPVSGVEVRFHVTFATPFDLPAGHYFFVPQVKLESGDFFWLSAPRPIVDPGTPFTPDLQSWIRHEDLQPDWLRIGTDIVGGTTFNAAFTLHGNLAKGNTGP